MNGRQRQPHTRTAALMLERHNLLILLVAGALALAAAMGLADMAGYSRLVDAVQDVVPTWFAVCFGGQVLAYLGYVLAVRDICRVDGGPLLSFRLSMRSVVAGFGVFAATHADRTRALRRSAISAFVCVELGTRTIAVAR